MLKIPPVKIVPDSNNVPSCTDDTIASVAKWLGLESRAMFARMWTFKLQNDSPVPKSLLERVEMPRPSLEFLDKIHGLSVRFVSRPDDRSDEDKLLAVIEWQMNNDMPVLVEMDGFYCPWTPLFQQNHLLHSCLLLGFDRAMDEITLMDAFFNEHCIVLSWNEFQAACGSYGIFDHTARAHSTVHWRELLVISLGNEGGLSQLRQTYDDLYRFTDLYADQGFHPNCTELPGILTLLQFIHNRRRYASFLQYLHEMSSSPLLNESAERMLQIISNWDAIWIQWIKIAKTGNKASSRTKLTGFMLQAIRSEEETLQRLVNLI